MTARRGSPSRVWTVTGRASPPTSVTHRRPTASGYGPSSIMCVPDVCGTVTSTTVTRQSSSPGSTGLWSTGSGATRARSTTTWWWSTVLTWAGTGQQGREPLKADTPVGPCGRRSTWTSHPGRLNCAPPSRRADSAGRNWTIPHHTRDSERLLVVSIHPPHPVDAAVLIPQRDRVAAPRVRGRVGSLSRCPAGSSADRGCRVLWRVHDLQHRQFRDRAADPSQRYAARRRAVGTLLVTVVAGGAGLALAAGV